MAAAVPAIAAIGSLAGGAAAISQADKPYAASAPGLQKAPLPQAQIPTASVKSDLAIQPLGGSGGGGAGMPTAPLASARDYNLMHLLNSLNGGVE